MDTVIDMNSVDVSTADTPVLDHGTLDNGRKFYLVIKRIGDILVALSALILLLPLLLFIALIVFIECPKANPIFCQTRIGKDGKRFCFFKFRSMIPDAEAELENLLHKNEMEGHAFKIKDDPRITKIGRFLRKTSLDEFPQLLNVIKGDMSIVGPRPPLEREYVNYSEYEKQRLYVTPGLTCYWQTTPNRNDMSFRQWLEMDIKYIKERSVKTDIRIILHTFGAVFGMHGV